MHLFPGQAVAGWFGADFSADIYQQQPGQPPVQGRMYVSDGRVRTEMNKGDAHWVEIIDPMSGKAWLLNTTSKHYRERPVPKGAGKDTSRSPCATLSQARCSLVGQEPVNGRPAEKWRIEREQGTQTQWVDLEHRFAVKVVRGGEPQMEMRFVGNEKLNGRTVEKWQSLVNSPRGAATTMQWYDPQLNIAVRQQSPNGAVRELRNIELGPQDEELFSIPDGYRRQQPNNAR